MIFFHLLPQLAFYQALRENSQHNVQVRDGLAELFLGVWAGRECGGGGERLGWCDMFVYFEWYLDIYIYTMYIHIQNLYMDKLR